MATSRPFSADSHCHWSAFPPDAHGASAVHGWPGGPERAPRYSSRLPSPPPAAPANGHDRDGRTATSSRFCTPVAAQPELTDLYRAAHAAGEGRSLKGVGFFRSGRLAGRPARLITQSIRIGSFYCAYPFVETSGDPEGPPKIEEPAEVTRLD
jgi:hypothetical protein